MPQLIWLFWGSTVTALLLMAGLLHLLPRLGAFGRMVAAACCAAPGLDLVITYFTIAPIIVGATMLGWWGVLAGVLAQIASVLIWTVLHEAANPAARKGPRIVHAINRSVGRFRNHAAVWWTAWAVPLFWVVRMGEFFIYPPLTWLVRLPKYKQKDWVNVSRQKFSGLVGHDLIWCLYCDWMTGVWSLGSEMLRNVESFWCPIRFSSTAKCANCSVDFPDINNGWAPAESGIAHAVAVVERQYPPGQRENSWFGHPARLTVKGETPARRGD